MPCPHNRLCSHLPLPSIHLYAPPAWPRVPESVALDLAMPVCSSPGPPGASLLGWCHPGQHWGSQSGSLLFWREYPPHMQGTTQGSTFSLSRCGCQGHWTGGPWRTSPMEGFRHTREAFQGEGWGRGQNPLAWNTRARDRLPWCGTVVWHG